MRHDLYRDLRRYALAGRQDGVRAVLEAMLREDSGDMFAMAELKNLEQGEPLQAARSLGEYRQTIRESISARLQMFPLVSPESDAGKQTSAQLREGKKQIQRLMLRLEAYGGTCPREVKAHVRHLNRTLLKRWVRAHRRGIGWVAALCLLIPMLAGAAFFLRQQAESATAALDRAVDEGRWRSVRASRESADTGIYRLLYPASARAISRADVWLTEKQRCYELAQRRLAPLARGNRSVQSLSLSERAAMERELAAIPPDMDDLSPVWQQLCRNEQEQLEQRKAEELARLQAPLPPWPEWTGDPEADAAALDAMLAETQRRHREFQDAAAAYHLPPEMLQPVELRLTEIRQRQAQLAASAQALQALDQADIYAAYRKARPLAPIADWYGPAVALSAHAYRLPDEEHLCDLMANREGTVPQAFVRQARNTYLKKGPTFTSDNPANARQVAILEDAFTARVLRTRLYETRDAAGNYAYSTTQPTPVQDGEYMHITRDGLDPAYHLAADPELTWRCKGMQCRVVDVTPLVAAAGFHRKSFYLKTNLPQALTNVLNVEAKDCPALARAYVYDVLLRVVMAHDERWRIGADFSPSLVADARTFMLIRDTCGIPLTPGCWLSHSPATVRAEERFAEWFETNKGHDYAAEIAANYGAIANVHPEYVGYVSPDGHAKLRHDLPPDTELWYVAQDGGIHRAPLREEGMAPENADAYSPLFVLARDTATP